MLDESLYFDYDAPLDYWDYDEVFKGNPEDDDPVDRENQGIGDLVDHFIETGEYL
jgi:hypothetical protein